MLLEIYDLECLSNLFTYTGYQPKTDKWFQYVICPWRNDAEELYKHLTQEKLCQVGFNNLAYDYPLLHHFLRHYPEEYRDLDGYMLSQKLYVKSQYLIDQLFTEVKKPLIKQVDLYKIWHYNNKARLTSLKDLEIHMRMENVEEMPFHHAHWCKQGEEIEVLKYNKNDG